jgi:hypothetical protein
MLAISLSGKCREFRDSSRLGKGIFPEKSSLGTSTPNFLENSGLAKGFIQPTEVCEII